MTICRICNCNQKIVVAGPPGERENGMCWEHAIGIADVLANSSPGTLARATGVFPVCDGKQTEEMDLLLQIRAVTGGQTLKRLGGF